MEMDGEAVPKLGEDLTYCEAFKVRRPTPLVPQACDVASVVARL